MAASKKTKSKSGSGPESASADSFVILLDDPDPEDESVSEQTAGDTVALRSHCTISDIAGIRQRLLNELKGRSEITIDLAAIGNVDTAFLQALCSLQLEADERDILIKWHEVTTDFRASADLLGLDEFFQAS
jgi:ABC-type transporter Mla MlaB component